MVTKRGRFVLKVVAGVGSAIITMIVAVGIINAQPIYRILDEGVTAPIILKYVRAGYTNEARRAGIEGTVVMEAVIRINGDVTDVRVTHSLDPMFGLDMQAIAAVRQWRFRSALKDGKPVDVRMECEMTFKL